MRKLIGFAVIFALLSFVGSAYGAVAIDDKDGYVGEVSNIKFEGQDVSIVGSQATVLTNGHKSGVTSNVSTESNLTSAALAYGVVELTGHTSAKYVTLANGTPGQMITFIMTEYNTATLYITDDKVSVATAAALLATGWDDIAFDAVNDQVTLLYVDDTYGWVIVGQYGVTVT